jgi:aryl-alcohol dehydrogenase-like predicted oxidoreductase
MYEKKDKKILTRKEFISTSTCMLTLGFIGSNTLAKTDYKLPNIILGRTNINVSPICYGASRTQEPALVKAVLDKGINFFDTGRSYSSGQNEVMLGKALRGLREQVVIQSKIKLRIRESSEELQSSAAVKEIKKRMEYSLNASLRALQTDYIDIMLFHNATSKKLLFHDAVLDFFNQARVSGKIRACGFSVHKDHLDIIEKTIDIPFFDVVMVPYNHKGSYIHSISGRFSEWDQLKLEKLLKQLHKKKVGIIAMKTCSAGPYAFGDSEKPSYCGSIKWVLNKDFIDCAAVAMANFDEIKEDLSL